MRTTGQTLDGHNGGINIVIPLGGLGLRFKKAGYRMTKPMVPILGEPMLRWIVTRLTLLGRDTLIIAVHEEVEEEFHILERVSSWIPHVRVRLIPLCGPTRGAADTLSQISNQMTTEELDRPTLSLDCDTIYFKDVIGRFRSLPAGSGCCFYFTDTGNKPLYSYISLDFRWPTSILELNDNDVLFPRITDIIEKERISNYANTGAYGFATGRRLKEYATSLMQSADENESREYYTSEVIARMIDEGHDFRGVFMEDTVCVGTPAQLKNFYQYLKSDPERYGICRGTFEIHLIGDLLLPKLTFPIETVGKKIYAWSKAKRNIRVVKSLMKRGHKFDVIVPIGFEILDFAQQLIGFRVNLQKSSSLHITDYDYDDIVYRGSNLDKLIGWDV